MRVRKDAIFFFFNFIEPSLAKERRIHSLSLSLCLGDRVEDHEKDVCDHWIKMKHRLKMVCHDQSIVYLDTLLCFTLSSNIRFGKWFHSASTTSRKTRWISSRNRGQPSIDAAVDHRYWCNTGARRKWHVEITFIAHRQQYSTQTHQWSFPRNEWVWSEDLIDHVSVF